MPLNALAVTSHPARYTEAIQGLEAFSPPHELVPARLARSNSNRPRKPRSSAIRSRPRLEQARSLVAKGDLAGAQAAADRAFAADREHVEARALRDEIAAKIVAEKRQQAREREAQQKASRSLICSRPRPPRQRLSRPSRRSKNFSSSIPTTQRRGGCTTNKSAARPIEQAERDADAGLQTAMARARTLIDTGNGEAAEQHVRVIQRLLTRRVLRLARHSRRSTRSRPSPIEGAADR